MTGIRLAMLLATCMLQPLLFCQTQPAALDVFLVVDNSGSMRQNDPRLSLPGALSTFARRLPSNSQLGMLIFDKDVKVVLELSRTDNKRFERDIGGALSKLNYMGSRSDLAGGVERAIYELRQQGRPDAHRVIVFVSDGILDLGSRPATAASSRWLREDLALEAKRFGVSIFAVTVSQAADYQLTLLLARTTGGEYYRALTPSLLPLALAQVNERLTKKTEVPPAGPVSPVGQRVLGGRLVLVSLVVIALAVLVLVAVFARRRPRSANAPRPGVLGIVVEEAPPIPSLSAVRERGIAVSRELANASDLLTQTNTSVNQFQTAVESYALSNYNELLEAEERCVILARECILLLDHLEIMIHRAEQKGERADSLRDARSRLCSLLQAAQIEEIPVDVGDVFDSAVQVATSVTGSSRSEGVVGGVSRKGYVMKVSGRKDVILRVAEVSLTSSQAVAQLRSGGPK